MSLSLPARPAANGLRFACIGAANWDHKWRLMGELGLGTSNPVRTDTRQAGGVVRNVAQNLAGLGHGVRLVCPVGDDEAGLALQAHARALGLDTSGCTVVPGAATGSYTAVLDSRGDMRIAFSDMALFDALPESHWQSALAALKTSDVAVLDLNLPTDGVTRLLDTASAAQIPVAVVAVSVPKMAHLPHRLHGLDLLLLNLGEWHALLGRPAEQGPAPDWAADWALLRPRGLRHAVITLGAQGAICLGPEHPGGVWLPPGEPLGDSVQDVTGAGDALAAGTLHGFYGLGLALPAACERGMALARAALQTSASAVSPSIGAPPGPAPSHLPSTEPPP